MPRASWTRCSCARSGRATRRSCSELLDDRCARGTGAAALLPAQQGPVVAARSQPAVPGGRAVDKAWGSQLLSGRRDQGATSSAGLARCRQAEQTKARGFFTTIRRTAPGSASPFQLVPYSLEYQGELGRRPRLLREAAALTTQPTLKRFLETRADAFLSDDYYAVRRRLDGARREHRADDRPVRGLRGRVVQLQGGLRGVHHAARRRRDGKLHDVRRRSCRTSRTICPSTRRCGTRRWARWRPSASSTSSSPPATATVACRPRRSTCPTTSGSSARRAASA